MGRKEEDYLLTKFKVMFSEPKKVVKPNPSSWNFIFTRSRSKIIFFWNNIFFPQWFYLKQTGKANNGELFVREFGRHSLSASHDRTTASNVLFPFREERWTPHSHRYFMPFFFALFLRQRYMILPHVFDKFELAF